MNQTDAHNKPRIIAAILLIDQLTYSFLSFSSYEYVGDPINIASILSGYEVDELLLVNKRNNIRSKSFCRQLKAIRLIADFPIAFTGGIKEFEDAQQIMRLGFDKIYLSPFSRSDKDLDRSIHNSYGKQALGMSLDYITENGERWLYDSSKQLRTNIHLHSFLLNMNNHIYSDIILTSVNNTGACSGLDGEVLRVIRDIPLTNPIVVSGGLRDRRDIEKVSTEYGHPYFSGVAGSSSIFLQSGSGSSLMCIERLITGDRT